MAIIPTLETCQSPNETYNESCTNLIDLEPVLHYSLLPSIAIIVVLSCLEKRARRNVIDEKCHLLNRRCGVVVPLDLMGICSSRWTMGFAFGATANKVMILFADGYYPLRVLPQWIKAIAILIGATEVGLSSYPFFACLSTPMQITGPTLGFLYTAAWFVIMAMYIGQCPHGEILGYYEKIIFYWPSLVCQLFLLGKFTHMLIKASWAQFQTGLPTDNTTLLETHHAQYVQQLLRKPPLQKPQKSWIQQNIYEWDPYFQFPSRMISTMVLAIICLYMFAVMEYYVYKLVSCTLVILISNYEMLSAANNVSDIQPLKEFIEVMEGVWIFTVGSASLTSVTYVFHILACYRKHIKRLRAGQKEFLPALFSKVSSSQSVGAIARYSGWQIAYLVWGYLVIHIIQCLFGVMLVYGLVLPVKHGQGIEMAKSLGTGILTIAIVIGFIVLQITTASQFFLQPKILQDDKEKPLALDNRKVFHNFNYFLFFSNVMLGLSACLFRLMCSVVLGAWLIARIDRTIMPKGYEAADMGYKTWIGMLFMDHYHTNPILLCFGHHLAAKCMENQQQRNSYSCHIDQSTDFRVSKKARTRWLLLYTLLKNPCLSAHRKPK
ncbi:stimulated by retinoic acid gene 6 protein-like [Pituophis catenifer annectens]|uniref:stimulated by retinoic acid gene 6 protein-like n=1 Tax=Pituophis catenifer annectens TaxID=94852 RepID=UPI003993C1C8